MVHGPLRQSNLAAGYCNREQVRAIIFTRIQAFYDQVFLRFSVEEYYKSTYKEDFRVLVFFTGDVEWKFGGNLKTSCGIRISNYPFDTQTCAINVESFVYPQAVVSGCSSLVIKQMYMKQTFFGILLCSVFFFLLFFD